MFALQAISASARWIQTASMNAATPASTLPCPGQPLLSRSIARAPRDPAARARAPSSGSGCRCRRGQSPAGTPATRGRCASRSTPQVERHQAVVVEISREAVGEVPLELRIAVEPPHRGPGEGDEVRALGAHALQLADRCPAVFRGAPVLTVALQAGQDA